MSSGLGGVEFRAFGLKATGRSSSRSGLRMSNLLWSQGAFASMSCNQNQARRRGFEGHGQGATCSCSGSVHPNSIFREVLDSGAVES